MEFPEFNFGDKISPNQIGSFETDEFNGSDYKQNEDDTQENKFSDTQIDDESCYYHNEFQELVCKDYSYNTVSQIRWKTIKPFEFFQLQCDCLIDIEYFERQDDCSYWSEKENPMFQVRPICKIYQYEQFGAYQLDTSITGLIDFDMPIRRLYDTQNQQAYGLAKLLEMAKQQFEQLNQLNQRLRSIFNINYLKEKLDANFEKSFIMAQDIARQLINNGDEYFVLLLVRVCPETMTYKMSMIFQSSKLSKLISNNNIDLLHRLALKQCMPYIFDVRSIVNMCQNMFNERARYQINISTLDQDNIPCDLEVEKVFLSSCEISQGIFLPDICIIQKYHMNPKLVQSIVSERVTNKNKFILYEDDDKIDQQKEFINKFYASEIEKKNLSKNQIQSYSDYSGESNRMHSSSSSNRQMIKLSQ